MGDSPSEVPARELATITTTNRGQYKYDSAIRGFAFDPRINLHTEFFTELLRPYREAQDRENKEFGKRLLVFGLLVGALAAGGEFVKGLTMADYVTISGRILGVEKGTMVKWNYTNVADLIGNVFTDKDGNFSLKCQANREIYISVKDRHIWTGRANSNLNIGVKMIPSS